MCRNTSASDDLDEICVRCRLVRKVAISCSSPTSGANPSGISNRRVLSILAWVSPLMTVRFSVPAMTEVTAR